MSKTKDTTLKDLKTVKFNTQIFEEEKINEEISKVKIRVMYVGLNRNNTFFSQETIDKMLYSLKRIPIVGEYKEAIDNFGGHGGKIEISDEGVKYIETTKPYGFIPDDTEITWEDVTEENGEVHSYLVCTGYLWTGRYAEELDKIFTQKFNQSMEVKVKEGNWTEQKYYEITDGLFSALCILGYDKENEDNTVEPCFESSDITLYTLDKKEFQLEFQNMLNAINKAIGKDEVNASLDNENGTLVVETTVEKVVETVEATLVTTENEANANETNTENQGVETDYKLEYETLLAKYSNKHFDKFFELSHDDIRGGICQLIWAEDSDYEWSWVMEVYDTYFEYETENWENDYEVHYYRRNYTKNADDTISIDIAKVELFKEMLTKEEKDALEEIRANYSVIKTELDTLKAELNKAEQVELSNTFDKVVNEFDLVEEDKKIVYGLKDKFLLKELTKDTVEEKCFLLDAKRNYQPKKVEKKEKDSSTITFAVTSKLNSENLETENSPYGDISRFLHE